MTDQFATEQEAFWAGQFGDEYSQRNTGRSLVAANCALFAKILSRTSDVRSLIEFGANIGLNLQAIALLIANADLAAVEINPKALKQLRSWGRCEVHAQSILSFNPQRTWDLVLIKGVLIHINPAYLPKAYDVLVRSARRYICLVEYYNPTPVSIGYRGHGDRLFKRDFAGELLDSFRELTLVDYGFCYHRDANFPQDDVTWFLLEKG